MNSSLFLLIAILNTAPAAFSYIMEQCNIQNTTCRCRSYKRNFDIDCSSTGLTEIPKLPKNVTKLDLSRNGITSLAGFPFQGLSKLEHLNLEQNKLTLQKQSFYPGLFKPLKTLHVLNLKNNIKSRQTVKYPGDIFSELILSQQLYLDASTNLTFDVNFSKLKYLRKLDLSGITGVCSMKSIKMETFIHLKSLRHLDISKCNIKTIEEGAFGFLQNLENLDISHNKELGFSSLPNITYNLNQTSIKSIRIDNINCLTGLGKKLLKQDLINIQNTSLEYLSLARNRLEILESGVFKNLPETLKWLSLAENKLTIGLYLFEFSALSNLRVLNMSLQLKPPRYTESLFEQCSESPQECEEDSYRDQLSAEMSRDMVSKGTRYNVYDKTWNAFRNSALNVLSSNEPIFTVYGPPKLERFYENSSRLYTVIPKLKLHAPGLRHMYLQDNMLYAWNGPIYGIDNLTHVDLSNNFCSNISSHFFQQGKGLEVLKIQHNYVGQVLEKDSEGVIFENQNLLKYLDITDNGIMHLPSSIFKNMSNLITLKLRNNRISDWKVFVSHMTNLTILDLSKNKVGSICNFGRKQLGKLFTTNNLSMNLADNDIMCSCQNLDFLNWMRRFKDRFQGIEHYTCSSINPTQFDFADFLNSLRTLQEFCKSYLVWYVVGAVLFTVTVSICVGLAIKRNIWTIRYFLYKLKHNVKSRKFQYTSIQNCHYDNHEFDAFISFSGRDSTFVMSELIPQLENGFGLKLLIRFRDPQFMPGEATSNNIMNAIRGSKKTICLVTKSYLKSNWRDYELNMAKMEGIKERGNLNYVHLILMPEVRDNCDMNKILDLVRKNYYIEYPSDERLREDFWSQLAHFIKDDSVE